MSETRSWTVAELTDRIKANLEGSFPSVEVRGEISNWRPAASGHCYFTLKDDKAQISAVMFRGKASGLRFAPSDGTLVVARGALSVYPPRGQYQLVLESMEKEGLGDILARLEALKRKLESEGLFDPDRKRPIPRFPSRVCVITSPTGAAIRDILNVLGRRNSGLRVLVLPTAVQGAEAAEGIRRRLAQANVHALGDVIILGRGGGSIEDLLAFSDEAVVRAVAASAIPVISAVGHEIDWSLADFAADLRAPTPSAAAELVSENAENLGRTLGLVLQGMKARMKSELDRARYALERRSVADFSERMTRLLEERSQRVDLARSESVDGMSSRAMQARARLERALASLEALDPRSVLARGYAIARARGKPVRSSDGLSPGDALELEFFRGTAVTRIVSTNRDQEAP